ncbi:lectin BRA-3-like [Saccostrea cucullata]|uniref:lectin BRA-3-like n=1 Tax=Saccostrea cuccullata TaxID=36930 RepID=UPI002ED37294
MVGKDNMIPTPANILFDNKGIVTLARCGDKCLAQYGCCSFFYNKLTKSCITATGDISGFSSMSGYKQYTILGTEILQGSCFGTSQYLISTARKSWDTAQSSCDALGGKLAEIQSKEENYFLQSLSKNIGDTVWIGGSDREIEDTWAWTENGDLLSFTFWGEKQPNNYHDQDCLTLFKEFDFLWADEDCDGNYHYICEKTIQ